MGIPRQPHRDRVHSAMEANSRKASAALRGTEMAYSGVTHVFTPTCTTRSCCRKAFTSRRTRQAQRSCKPWMQKVHAGDATSDALPGMSDCNAQTHISILFRLRCFTPVDLCEDDRSVHDVFIPGTPQLRLCHSASHLVPTMQLSWASRSMRFSHSTGALSCQDRETISRPSRVQVQYSS